MVKMRTPVICAGFCLLATACLPDPTKDATSLCRPALDNYFVSIDQMKWDVFPEIFTEDATVTLRDGTYEGLDEIKAYFVGRDPQPNIIHHLTTAAIKQTSDNQAVGVVYVLIQGEAQLPDGTNKAMLYSGYYEDEYVLTETTCKISKRKLNARFLHPLGG